MQSHYHSVYDGWKADPEGFWKKAAEAIDWFREPEQIFSTGDGVYGRWFKGGETNTCFNCLDRMLPPDEVARAPSSSTAP